MATRDENREVILETAIAEQRRVYDWISTNYQRVRTKATTYIGAGLATLTFLYSHPNPNIQSPTFIPPQTYGKILYFAGLGLMLGALFILGTTFKPVIWEFPIEDKVLKKLDFSNKLEYLEYVKERYRTCYKINVDYCEEKHKLVNMAFPMLVSGAIILMVLNLFGG